jgi:hypothetical protein
MKNKINLLTIISLGFCLVPFNVLAKPVVYDFKIEVNQGNFKGKTYDGFLMYDDENQNSIITVEDGLKVCLNFFEQIHNETKDVDYPKYPKLTLKDGKPETLDFWTESPKRRLWWNRDGWEVTLTPRKHIESSIECDTLSQN